VIIRLLRGRVAAGDEGNLTRFVRDEAVARALKVPGLMSFQPAIRQAGLDGASASGTRTASEPGIEVVMVSTWAGFDEMSAAGLGVGQPLAIPELSPLLVDSRAEHYELVLGEARAMPLRQAKLRLTHIPIKPNHESAYYAAVRPWAERLLDQTGLVSFTLGRRVVGRRDEIVAVQMFEDEAALRDAAGSDIQQPMGRRELSEFWAGEPVIEHFDALTAIEPRPDAPAILLADDSRRYVHATPAAARLSGRPLARLRGRGAACRVRHGRAVDIPGLRARRSVGRADRRHGSPGRPHRRRDGRQAAHEPGYAGVAARSEPDR